MAPELGDVFPSWLYPVYFQIGLAQGLQMVLLTELECSRTVAKGLGARLLFYPLQNSGPETA